MEWGRLVVLAALPSIHSRYGSSSSVPLRTITAIVPSGFVKAVVCKASRLEELTMRLAPGLMNLEKCPM